MMSRQRIEKILRSALLLLVVALGIACSESGRIKTTKSAQPYDFEKIKLHPEFKLFHESAENSELYFRINTAELLYARVNPNEPFRANIELKLHVLQGNNIYDSLSISISDTNDTRLAKMLNGKLELGIPDSLSGVIRVSLIDKLKGSRATNDIAFDKRDIIGGHNFLLSKVENGEVIFDGNAEPMTRIEVKTRNKAVQGLMIDQYPEFDKLPPPPFSYYNPDPINKLTPEYSSMISPDSEGRFIFLAESGYYLIKYTKESASGIGLKVISGDYPKLTRLDDLVETLRYITSKKEFDDIRLSKDTKIKLDDFWLECGGSMDKSRDLIRIYYGRVEEANRYFSCHLDGWKTDRGLVHIVYGNPTKVVFKSEAEIWIYGEENNINTLSFSFRKENNELTDNYYVLSRDPIYKTSWSRAVDSWRNGRIYND